VYLLRDPTSTRGTRVEAKGVTGTVAAIELRKTRIDTDTGDRVVLANGRSSRGGPMTFPRRKTGNRRREAESTDRDNT